MQIEAAHTHEQGVDFVVLVVRRAVLSNHRERDEAVIQFSQLFDGIPAVLMAQDTSGTPEYYGRTDLVNWLQDVPFEALPWATYTVS